jgi:LacI family transcriptional regulator
LFYEHGHRRIGCVIGTSSWNAESSWRDAFILEVASLGLSYPIQEYTRIIPRGVESVKDSFAEAAASLLDMPHPPTAILLCADSSTAIETIRMVTQRGLRVGQDVSLVAGDEVEDNPHDLPLSVFCHSPSLMGRELVDAALRLAEDHHLIIQKTTPHRYCDFGSVGTLIPAT